LKVVLYEDRDLNCEFTLEPVEKMKAILREKFPEAKNFDIAINRVPSRQVRIAVEGEIDG